MALGISANNIISFINKKNNSKKIEEDGNIKTTLRQRPQSWGFGEN